MSPCSSAPFRWGRRSCLGLRTGVSPHFSMNSMREILALRGGYERGRVPLPSPMPPESGAPPHNTHPSMVPPRHSHAALAYSSLFPLALSLAPFFSHMHIASNRCSFIPLLLLLFLANSSPVTDTTIHHEDYHPT